MNFVDLVNTDKETALAALQSALQDKVFNYLDSYSLSEDVKFTEEELESEESTSTED